MTRECEPGDLVASHSTVSPRPDAFPREKLDAATPSETPTRKCLTKA